MSKKVKRNILIVLLVAATFSAYIYKCYTDPYFYKSELYDNAAERCKVLSKYIPDGSTREHVEKILIDSDGARIEPNNPNSKGSEVGSVIYNLDPWVVMAHNAAVIYVWYDSKDKVTGLSGTHCSHDRHPLKKNSKS
jgi:hypothetical protein